MEKKVIKLPNWPFTNGERAKLIKISKPYLYKGKWFLEAEFLSLVTNKAAFLKHHFADLHLLILGAEYIDGVLQIDSKWQTKDIRISTSDFQIKPYLVKDKYNSKFDYYTIGVRFLEQYYIIPLIEIVRAVLAPDVFWLNQITMMDSIDTRMICDYKEDSLEINFCADVPVRYASMDSSILHIGWVFSNSNILKMIRILFQNIQDGNGILFDFLFKELWITVKFEINNGRNFVREIVACRRKRILTRTILVDHPGFYEYVKGEDGSVSSNRVANANAGSSSEHRVLTSDVGAKKGGMEVCDFAAIKCEYSTLAKIKRNRKKKITSESEDSLVQASKGGTSEARTTADFGGLNTVPQLEFSNLVGLEWSGKFGEILNILREIEKRMEVRKVRFHVGDLKVHRVGRAICTLDDDVTPRQYCIGFIELANGKEAVIIEIDKPNISTWLLVSMTGLQKWNRVCHQIIKRFVEKSGVWPEFEEVSYGSIQIHKYRHTTAATNDKVSRIMYGIVG